MDGAVSDDARERFVVVGASNVSHAFGAIVADARARARGPLEVIAVHGHGRSFGAWSRVAWVRELPGILASDAWPLLAARAAPRTNALVTDLGNDLVYGYEPEVVAGWVETVLERLARADARIVVTGVPLASLERLGRVRFELARRVLFPGRPLALATVRKRALALDELVRRAARARDVAFVAPRGEWYGLDPIHVRRGRRAAAFGEVLEGLGPRASPLVPLARDESRDLARLRPALRRWFGREQRAEQPGVRWNDGTTVAWY